MAPLTRIGWRSIWRNKRRSVITLLALSFSLAFMILLLGIQSNFMTRMVENATGLTLGDVQVHHPDYPNEQNMYQTITDYPRKLAQIGKLGYRASPRVYGYGLVSNDQTGKSAGVRIEGMMLAEEAKVTTLLSMDNLRSGNLPTNATREWTPPRAKQPSKSQDALEDPLADVVFVQQETRTVLIGEVAIGGKLARSLGAKIGHTINVMTMAADGSIGNEVFEIVGIFKNFSEIEDRTLVLMGWECFQRLFVLPTGECHELAVKLPQGADLKVATEQLKAVVGADLKVRTWRELQPALSNMIEVSKSLNFVFIFIMYLGAGMVIMNSMLMVVFERIPEYGILKALGVKGSGIFLLVCWEALGLCLFASALGTAGGILWAWLFQQYGIDLSMFAPEGLAVSGTVLDPVIRADISSYTVFVPLVTLYIIVFVAVLYPAGKAARLEPVDALSHL